MQRYACLDLNKLGLDYGGIQKDEERLALKRQKDRERKRRSKARKAIAKQEAKALAADAEMAKKEGEAMGEASADDIFIGGLNIGKCELDKEVSYSVFIVSMHKVSLYKSILTRYISLKVISLKTECSEISSIIRS